MSKKRVKRTKPKGKVPEMEPVPSTEPGPEETRLYAAYRAAGGKAPEPEPVTEEELLAKQAALDVPPPEREVAGEQPVGDPPEAPVKPGGTPRVALSVSDEVGRKLVVHIPLKDVPLHAVAGIEVEGLYVVEVRTNRGVAQVMQTIDIDVPHDFTLADAVHYAMARYDDHKDEARDAGRAAVLEQGNRIAVAGSMPQ